MTFTSLFRSYRKDVSGHARLYLQGLLNPTIRKTVEDIAEAVPDADVQNLQQFISSSKWSSAAVLKKVAESTNELIGDPENTALLIDESGIAKKGKHSVGVARQWLGCLGKTDNGQVGVYASLCKGTHSSLINTRLYLPQCWIDDRERCQKAGVPDDHIRMRDKEELGIEMVDDAVDQKLSFGWVGADAGYGKSLWFMLQVEQRHLQFAVDIHKDMRIYMEKPHPYLPERTAPQGREPTHYVVDQSAVRADRWAESLKSSAWKDMTIRDSTKGPLCYEVTARRVFVWAEELKEESRHWWLVVRRNAQSHDDYKYTLINAPAATPIERLAYMQGQRYWIEHAIEVCKGDCGMDQYEVRSWNGWHHHMALAMMAQLFLLKESLEKRVEYPLLSPRDVMILLSLFLPQKELSIDEVIQEMEKRHEQRKRTKKSAVNKFNAQRKLTKKAACNLT